MNNIEKILVFATVIAPFTLLRFGFIGFGELSILFLFIYSLQKGYLDGISKKMIFSSFWSKFIVVSLFGFAYNVIVLGYNGRVLGDSLFDLLAYLMLFISCFLVENLHKKGLINSYLILRHVFLYSGIAFGFLYVVSQFTPSIFGLPIKYYHYFAPFVKNIHQTAMIMTPLSFLGLFLVSNEKSKFIKLIFLVLILMFSFIATETGSFKAFLAVVICWVVFIVIKILKILPRELKNLAKGFIIILTLFFIINNLQKVEMTVIEVFTENDGNNARSNLYRIAIDTGFLSPVFGLGPGPQLDYMKGGLSDAHQTFLTVFLQAGIIGIILFVVLVFKILKYLSKDSASLVFFIAIFIYLAGGDILRRLPIWLLLLFFYYYIESQSKNELIKK